MSALIIDTTSFQKARLEALGFGQNFASKTFKAERQLSDKLLPAIISLLSKKNLRMKDLKKIVVYKSDQGSFTGARVGIAVAKALGFGLKIPVRILKIKNEK